MAEWLLPAGRFAGNGDTQQPLMERHVVPPERVERVQAVIDGWDPCPPTLINWLMTLPWREKPVHRGRADRPPDRRAGRVH